MAAVADADRPIEPLVAIAFIHFHCLLLGLRLRPRNIKKLPLFAKIKEMSQCETQKRDLV